MLPGVAGTSSINDLAIAMPFSYTDTAGIHYGLDVKIADTVLGGFYDDTVEINHTAYTHVSLASMPDGGFVLAYDDNGTEYLRDYGNDTFVVGGCPSPCRRGSPTSPCPRWAMAACCWNIRRAAWAASSSTMPSTTRASPASRSTTPRDRAVRYRGHRE